MSLASLSTQWSNPALSRCAYSGAGEEIPRMRVPKSIQFALALVALFPFVIIALIFAGMITHIAYTTFHHHMAWQPTVATVLRAGTLCKITYQPEGAILRKVVARGPCERIRKAPLPTTGRKPRVE
jgi:hypothetical protein